MVLLFSAVSLCNAGELKNSANKLEPLEWMSIAPGIWKTVIGEEDDLRLTDLRAAEAKVEALQKMPEVKFPLNKSECKGYVFDGKAAVRLPFGKNEQMYGLGLQFEGMNRQKNVYHLRTDTFNGNSHDRIHAPVPFYVSSEGYGVLINSSRRVSIYAATAHGADDSDIPPRRDRTTDKNWQYITQSSHVEASVSGPGVEIIVFAGPTAMDAVRRYNLYNGGGCLPPKWGLGFWSRFHSQWSADAIAEAADEYAKMDFPLDVVGLEPGWQNWAYPCDYTWNNDRYPDPAGFIKKMSQKGLHVDLWIHAYLHPKSPLYKPMLPLSGSHMMYGGIAPDYSLPDVRDKFSDYMGKTLVDIGVSGLKIDECDGGDDVIWPDHAMFPSGLSGERMRAVYGLYLQKTVYQMYRERNQRTYGLVRASNGGASGYPFVLYSDNYDHSCKLSALCNSSFSGILWTPEIGRVREDDDSIRRMQTVCMSPLAMLNGYSSAAKPWLAGKKGAKAIQDAMQLRMSLLPYLYSTFAEYYFEGTPPIRAMSLCEGYEDKIQVVKGKLNDMDNPYAVSKRIDKSDQYMLGDSLLVAPIIPEKDGTSRSVILPAGKWYDFYTGKFAGEGETINVKVPLDKMALFVKDGGIIPMIKPVQNVASIKDGTKLTVRHYGTKAGSFSLYDDDGKTFDYEKGNFAWIKLTASIDGNGKMTGKAETSGNYKPIYGKITWKFMSLEK